MRARAVRGRYVTLGTIQDRRSCTCEWGFALPPDLPIVPPGAACPAAGATVSAQQSADDL